MPLLLRVVKKAWWFPSERPAWLPAGEVPAASFNDLRTENNALSVWQIEEDRSNLDTVIAALASMRDSASVFDHVFLDRARIEAIPVKIQKSEGESPDLAANQAWHHDLVELTGRQLAAVALAIANEGAKIIRVKEKSVVQLIGAAVGNGRFSVDSLSPSLRAKVHPLINPPL